MPVRKISEILGAENALGNLAAASRRVEQLQRIYVEAVPADLSRASRVGWARAGVVSVIANNGAVAAKLRQLKPRILAGFMRHGLEFNSMRIEVQVDAGVAERGARAPKPLPRQALAAIEEALQSLPRSPLREALRRLARRRAS
jgi:hypothetical protein